MPPLNLLLLPLLGGFVFVSKWYVTRYYTLRSDGYRLVFAASIAGAAFLFLACVVIAIVSALPIYPRIGILWHAVIEPAHSGKAVLAFLMGMALWWPANKLGGWVDSLSDRAAVERAISHKQDPLEMLLRRAMGSKSEVSLALKTGEIYVGRLCRNFNPAFPMESVGIIPSFKGHRNKKNFKFTRDMDYEEARKALGDTLKLKVQARLNEEMSKRAEELHKNPVKDPLASATELLSRVRAIINREEDLQRYEVVLPVAEILSVNIYDKTLEPIDE
jgi:hypothetical protein